MAVTMARAVGMSAAGSPVVVRKTTVMLLAADCSSVR
jgi:hypothetical protein